MNVTADDPNHDIDHRSRLRFELIFGSLWLAFGLFLLPALIYWVGTAALGDYGENASLGAFYSDFFGDLADASGRAWTLALGPLVLIYLLRAVFIGVRPKGGAVLDDEPAEPVRQAPIRKETKRPADSNSRQTSRVEPRMSGD